MARPPRAVPDPKPLSLHTTHICRKEGPSLSFLNAFCVFEWQGGQDIARKGKIRRLDNLTHRRADGPRHGRASHHNEIADALDVRGPLAAGRGPLRHALRKHAGFAVALGFFGRELHHFIPLGCLDAGANPGELCFTVGGKSRRDRADTIRSVGRLGHLASGPSVCARAWHVLPSPLS
jgi:hypothetical protein